MLQTKTINSQKKPKHDSPIKLMTEIRLSTGAYHNILAGGLVHSGFMVAYFIVYRQKNAEY